LNQLDHNIHKSHNLDWLPRQLPPGIKIVVSCLKGDCLEILKTRQTPESIIKDLTEEDRREIVVQTLSQYNKKLETT
jgi:hypothetical protein